MTASRARQKFPSIADKGVRVSDTRPHRTFITLCTIPEQNRPKMSPADDTRENFGRYVRTAEEVTR
jgi:hypothetical protein